MWQQRVHTLAAELRRRDDRLSAERRRRSRSTSPRTARWRPFQLAFVLLNLPGLAELDHPERSDEPDGARRPALVPDRRRQDRGLPRPDGLHARDPAAARRRSAGRRGEDGVAVLMRYTLRLLTLQQFQRATALICACEVIRREALERGRRAAGARRRSGSACGSGGAVDAEHDRATPTECGQAGARQPAAARGGSARRCSSPRCPWCGTSIDAGDATSRSTREPRRTLLFCGDTLGRVPVHRRKQPGRGAAGRRRSTRRSTGCCRRSDRHGRQVRPDAVEGRDADALRPGRRPLRAPRLPLAGRSTSTPSSHPQPDGELPAARTVDRAGRCARPT